ncbi:MAG: DsrE family protein [Planctomycetaceae bacterium]|nr:DsrE family protein [Planctomycetaceae bacterium]
MSAVATQVIIILTEGKSDNGRHAVLAFSCGLSALAMGQQAAVYLTSDGAVWGYTGSSEGITVPGFPPLQQLMDDYLATGGRLLLCSVCERTCGAGGPQTGTGLKHLPQVELAGFATMLELATNNGVCITF